MSRLEWAKPEEKLTQGGLDRGVLYPSDKPAVPWNGLVNVSESGNQQTNTYFVDGRRFLTTVTPREYNATLTAITFPDEFAEICGLVEAADGLFLDSQVPDQFGLSYRTMYDNGEYKIHLIYGVTAAMSDVSYQTLSGSANDPTPFEFQISAVPQAIEGFRATAHVIIDSRNLDRRTLANIENKIYGTYGQDAYLPTIKSLYDMMNYGQIVVIRDNGDGTWEAEGSYKYISIDEVTGEFVITNVTVQDLGGGKYKVASTNETIV